MQILTEKYRPKTLSDMVGNIPDLVIDDSMPHLLLHGSAGCGKTTLARIIISMLNCDHIVLNASSERGIDVIRDKVRDFASTKSRNETIKIVFLDEADHLTPDAQTALRNTMETYSRNTRFILTANYINRIIEPLQSRCIVIKFGNILKSDILKRLQFICENEHIPYEIDALSKITDQTGSDIRSAINKIEQHRSGVYVKALIEPDNLVNSLLDLIDKKDFISSRQCILDEHPDYDQLLKDLENKIMLSSKSTEYKMSAIHEIAETYKFINQVAWKEILIENLILQIMKL